MRPVCVPGLFQILDDFPKVDDVHPFYADLMNVLYDKVRTAGREGGRQGGVGRRPQRAFFDTGKGVLGAGCDGLGCWLLPASSWSRPSLRRCKCKLRPPMCLQLHMHLKLFSPHAPHWCRITTSWRWASSTCAAT